MASFQPENYIKKDETDLSKRIANLEATVNNLIDILEYVLSAIDEDNMTDSFLGKLGG